MGFYRVIPWEVRKALIYFMALTKAQKSAIVGMVLGDGFLQSTGKKNARLRLEHSLKQQEFLKWKMSLVPQFFQNFPSQLTRIHPITKRKYAYIRAQSHSSPFLGKLKSVFYPKGKKKIPENLTRYLRHPLGLAIWYLDDGYYYKRDKIAELYLGRVSKKEAEIARRAIKERFGIEARLKDKKNKGFVLSFSPEQTQKFARLIKKFVIKSMNYKLPSLTP